MVELESLFPSLHDENIGTGRWGGRIVQGEVAGVGRHLAMVKKPSAVETSRVYEGDANEDC